MREEQAITSQQLDAPYSRMDELAYAKSQLENEISELDSKDVYKRQVISREVFVVSEGHRKPETYCANLCD